MGCGPIILRKYMRKYVRIEASYTDDLGRRLEALLACHCGCGGTILHMLPGLPSSYTDQSHRLDRQTTFLTDYFSKKM